MVTGLGVIVVVWDMVEAGVVTVTCGEVDVTVLVLVEVVVVVSDVVDVTVDVGVAAVTVD